MLAEPTVKTLLTFEEFEALPEYAGKQELLEGELIELPPPEAKHNRDAEEIRDRLRAAVRDAHARGEALDLGEVFHEMGYKLGADTWVTPDVSVTHAGQPEGRYIEGAPAIAIEIVSPGNTAEQIERKVALYFEHGAREVWCFYRKTRQVVVHVPGESRVVTDRVTTPLLPGFALEIDEILGE